MNDATSPPTTTSSAARAAVAGGWRHSLLRRAVLASLERLEHGRLRIFDGQDEFEFGDDSADVVTIEGAGPGFWTAVALDGDMGAAESYMNGDLQCSDLTALVRLFIRNRAALERIDSGFARVRHWVRDALRFAMRNSRRGSRRNIAAHYDLGNDMFRLFLDSNMMYSSAVFPREDATLEEAARYKNELVCAKLDLCADDHLLEIGTGWGGLAIHAARTSGCRVTTTTVSRRQFELATARVREAGLDDRIDVLLQDYRDLDGQYDKLVSIEMLEAVGHEYYDEYFAKCSELLRSDGLMVLQTITMNEQNYLRARDHVDFIKKYIFPGGCLPSISAITNCLRDVTDMNVAHISDIGRHYERTLQCWRERFEAAHEQIRQLGYDERFVRMWRYYLQYCEAAFAERVIGDAQLVLFKPGNRRADLAGIAL